MNRREFLQGSLGAAFVAPFVADLANGQQQAGQQQPSQPPAPRSPLDFQPVPITRKLILDANSRSLQWLRTADDVAKAAIEMVCGGVCVTVQPYPGHVDPARAAQDLPAFANRLRSHGLRVAQINGPAITDASDPKTEAIIGAAAQAGCTHCSLGTYTYDLAQPLAPQLDAIKARVEKLVRLNQKHNVKLLYDTVPGAASVGANVLDMLGVMKEFDPKFVGFRWDTGHMALHGDGMWEPLLRLAGPYVAAIAWRDRAWVQDLGLLGEGGPYAGPHPRVSPLVTLPNGSAVPGDQASRGSGAGGRGAGNPGEDEEGGPPPGFGGRGNARGPANSAGAGSIDANNPLYRSKNGEMPKRPIGGKNAKGGGWSAVNAAMGTGVLHIPQLATVLADIGFDGPSALQSEYAGIGGAERGADTINRPRQWVIGMLKRDVLTVRKAFEMANCGVAI